MSNNHSFNIHLAGKLGITEAIILQNIYFWINEVNAKKNKHVHDGVVYMYNTSEDWTKQLPYMKIRQIKKVLSDLSSDESQILCKGCFNSVAYDRTLWYGFTEYGLELLKEVGYNIDFIFLATGKISESVYQKRFIHLPNLVNGITQEGKPIPNTNTDTINTNKKTIQKEIGDESPLDVETSVSPSTETFVDLEIKNQTPAKQQKEIVEESPQVPQAPLKNTRDEKSLERFEKEWHTYGKKVDKKRAWSLYKKLTNEQQIAMHEALPAYIASTPDVKFRKNLSTYISQESWNDEIINNTKNTNQNGGQQAQIVPRKTLKYL